MKHKTLFTALLFASSTLLSGCLTNAVWNDSTRSKPVIESRIEYQSIGEDTFVGFAQVPSSQQIAMVGEKYIYLLDEEDSKELLYISNNLHLSNPFTVKEPIQIAFEKEKDGLHFYTRNSTIALIYHPATPQEKKSIEKLRQDSSNRKVGISLLDDGNYVFYIKFFGGNVYATGENIKIAKTSHNARIPISLYSSEIHSKLNGKSLIKKVVATPFALAGDIIFLPLELILPKPRFR